MKLRHRPVTAAALVVSVADWPYVMLLRATQVLFIASLVLVGISALCMSMPLKLQPAVTELFVHMSAAYLLYGAHPMSMASIVLAAFSSITILLACIPLWDALRSSGPKRIAAILLAPLALFSLLHLGQAGYGLTFSGGPSADVFRAEVYFWPEGFVGPSADLVAAGWGSGSAELGVVAVEAAKWGIILAIAVWLSIAQLAAWRQARRAAGR